jgi:hypothetical protein
VPVVPVAIDIEDDPCDDATDSSLEVDSWPESDRPVSAASSVAELRFCTTPPPLSFPLWALVRARRELARVPDREPAKRAGDRRPMPPVFPAALALPDTLYE